MDLRLWTFVWTFGFEGFNKVIKAGANHSNWKDETFSIMRYWSMRTGWEMAGM